MDLRIFFQVYICYGTSNYVVSAAVCRQVSAFGLKPHISVLFTSSYPSPPSAALLDYAVYYHLVYAIIQPQSDTIPLLHFAKGKNAVFWFAVPNVFHFWSSFSVSFGNFM